jgi:hypothetical protein
MPKIADMASVRNHGSSEPASTGPMKIRVGSWFEPITKVDIVAPTWTYGISWSGFLVVKGGCLRMDHNPAFPLELALKEIDQAIEHRLYYLAVSVALSIPDICARLELPRGHEVKEKHYVAWIERYFLALNDYPMFLKGIDLYQIRCGVLHQGASAGHRKLKTRYNHVFFCVLGADGKGTTATVYKEGATSIELDSARFCRDMIKTARAWYKAKKADPNVVSNLPDLVRPRPEGYPPFTSRPVIG